MSEHHAPFEVLAGRRQGLAHVAEQEKFWRRYAIRMCSDLPLANIDFAAWQELAKMIISPTVTEAEFEHLAIYVANQMRGAIQARALGFETPYKTIKPAHEQSSSDTGRFTQPIYFGARSTKLVVCRIQPVGQLLHDRDSYVWEFPHHAHKRFFRDA